MLLSALWAQEDGTGCLDEQYPVRPSFCCRKRPGMIPPFRSPYHYPVVRCCRRFSVEAKLTVCPHAYPRVARRKHNAAATFRVPVKGNSRSG